MDIALAAPSGRAAELRHWLRRQWPIPFRSWVLGRDVALCYAVIVLVISLMVAIQPPHRLAALVEQSSTNLANMAAHPFAVLVLSAFVVSPAAGLVLLIPVVVAYGELQRWLGRAATIVVVVFGHVGATLVVMTLEIAALHRRLVGFDIVVKPDVGVSYGLFAVIGVLLARLPQRWRMPYGIACLLLLVLLLIVDFGFTNVGHASAWLIGVSLSLVVHRGAAAAQAPTVCRKGSAG